MKVVFCWVQYSGYMAACWRELAKRDGVDLFVVAQAIDPDKTLVAFGEELLGDVDRHLFTEEQLGDDAHIEDVIAQQNPDVLVINGWWKKSFVRAAMSERLSRAKLITGMDNQFRDTLRQRLGKYRHRSLFRRMDRIVVASERSWQLARVLGFEEERIRRGWYGFDFDSFAPAYETRLARPDGWPRRFLFVGRFVPVKGIDVLLEAYAEYRRRVSDPWSLSCAGRGPYEDRINAAEGVENLGFLQPADQPGVFSEHGAFLLSSTYEPWGVVIPEAAAAGLPVVCTESCGAALDVVYPYFNGITVPTGDVPSLTRSMLWLHENHDKLPEMGRRGREIARAHGAEAWADRWTQYCREVLGE